MKYFFRVFLSLVLLFSIQQAKSQAFTFSVLPSAICFNPSGTNTVQAVVQSTGAAVVVGYSFVVVSPSPCGPVSQTIAVPNGSIAVFNFTCCGTYTINGFAYAAGNILIDQDTRFASVICASGASITPSTPSNTVCTSTQMSLTASGMTTYTWTSSAGGGGTTTAGVNPLVIAPTCSANYAVNGVTVAPTGVFGGTIACPVSNSINIYVQSASLSVAPVNPTVCPTSPLCLTSTVTVPGGTCYVPGTVTTSLLWYNPSGATVNPCTSPAAFGTYTAILTHSGTAGTCSISQAVNVFTSSTFPVTLTASSASVCPGGSVQLTAVSIQTAASGNYTWTQNFGGPIAPNNTITIIRNPTTFPRNYTVDVNYFGCTGQATTSIGLLTLTPTLTPSSPSVCPGTSLNLLASGGTNYTITAIPFVSGGNTVVSTGTNTSVNFTCGAGQFPWQFAVSAASTGCTGSNTIVIGQLVLNPQFTSSSYSVCPGTNFTLSSTGGAGTNYTFTSPPNTVLQTGLTNTVLHSAPNSTSFPRTYTVSVDSVGCKGDATLTISELTLFPAVSLSSPSVCLGTSFCFTATGGAGTTYTYLAPTNTVPVTSSVVPKGALTDPNTCHDPQFGSPPVNPTYTLLADSVGCKGSATFTVGIKDLSPNISMFIGGGPGQPTITTACPASQMTLNTLVGLNTANYTYTYTIPGPPSFTVPTTPSGANTLNLGAPANASLFPATYTVQVDSAGCIGTQTIALNLRVLNPSVNSSTNSICANNVVTICANPARALTLYSFIGVNASGTIGPVPSPPQPNPCQNFTLTQPTVFYVFADSAGCTNLNALPPSTVLVSISQSLTIGATASPSIICSGQPSTLSVIGNSVYTYTWTAPSGTTSTTISNTTTAFVNPTLTTTYTVNALDPVGCIGIQTVVLQVDPTASLSMVVSAPVTTICNNQGGAQQSTTLTAGGAVNYSWSPPAGLSNTSSSITIASPTAPLVYTVVGNNGLGCFGAAQITITSVSYPIPVISAGVNGTAVCSGFNTTLTAFASSNPPSTPIMSYTWTGTTFSNAIVQPSIVVVPGTYTVIGSAGGSCTNTAVQLVTSAPNLPIVAQAALSGTTCIIANSPKLSKPVKLSATGGSSYIWQPYDPLTMTYSLGANTDVRPQTSTCYTVTGFNSSCSGSAQICVTVAPQFTINVTPPNPAMCLGDSMKLSVVSIGPGAVGNQALYTYSWTDPAPISLDQPLSPSTMAFPISTITYSVDVADTRSCVSMPRLITVSVLPRPETNVLLPIINNVPTNTICFVGLSPGPSDVLLTLTAQNGNTGLPFGVNPTYTWNSPNGTILTDRFQPQVTINAPYRLPSVVVYTVVSGYNGVQGCRSEDTVSVRVIDCRPITIVSFTTATENDTACARGCITFMNLTDTLAGGPQQLSWTFEGGSPATSTLANPTICYNLPGKFNVILKVTNPYPRPGGSSGIKGTTEFVTIVDIPNVTIKPPGQLRSDTTIRYGESIVLEASGAYSYSWKPDYFISTLAGPAVTVTPLETTEYVVFGRNSQNCESSDTMIVYVEKECGDMFVPTAFSPNGDTHNDELFVKGICLESMTFMIFNRWGEKVFETTDQKKGWDGTYKEREMDTGVYFYRLEGKTYDGKGFSSKGNVTLLR